MLLMIALDVSVPRIAAKAARRLRMSSVMPTSRGRSFASHGPLGCFVVSLIVFPARNSGHWLDTVSSDALVGYESNESDVRVRK